MAGAKDDLIGMMLETALKTGKRPRMVHTTARGNRAFMHADLTPSQNKIVEMVRNGFSVNEIADETALQPGSIYVMLTQARKKLGPNEVPKLHSDRGRKAKFDPAYLVKLRDQGLTYKEIEERTGVSKGLAAVHVYHERKRRRPVSES